MSIPEPAIPPTVADRFDAPAAHNIESSMAASEGGRWRSSLLPNAMKQWRRLVGLLLLGLTIFMWTATNFLSSSIFADDTYSKPYFVTYINTSFFIIPLIPILINKAYRNPEEVRRWKDELRTSVKTWRRYTPLKQEEAGEASYHDSPMLSASQARSRSPAARTMLDEAEMEHSQVLSAKDLLRTPSQEAPLTLPEIAKLSLEFCMLWFLANYFVAACLQYTTVASSTILTSTSSVFTLVFGAIFKVEKFTIRKLLGVLASLAGIAIISSLDLSGNSSDDEHRGDFPEKSLREIAIGDCLAFLSAVMYGLYAVFMKKRISDETRVDMPVFFGFVGVINVLILWPGLFIFHWLGIETLEAPPTWRVTLIILCNSLGSLIGDIAWAYAVLLTSPIVVTVGLSITIPCSLIGQIVLNNQTAGIWYWLGACIVVLSFLFVNHEENKDEEEEQDSMPLSVEDVSATAPRQNSVS